MKALFGFLFKKNKVEPRDDQPDSMLSANPARAANLIALLARELSQRLRVVSARLNDNK